jgi:NAD(P)-dependent dehydrogenase (short-subunit alcohol dehydrogenase family)
LIEKEGRKVVLVAGDLRSADHCRQVVDRAVKDLGGVDILVNNAAHQATFKDLGDISDDEWRLTFEVNIHAMFFLAKAAVPHMPPGGAIINTASVNSDMPNPMLLAYATAKGAIQNFTGGLAQMLAEKSIRVNAVAPGRYGRLSFRRPCRKRRSRTSASRFRSSGQGSQPNSRRRTSCLPIRFLATRPGRPWLSPAENLLSDVSGLKPPATADGQYFVVRGKLWGRAVYRNHTREREFVIKQ